VLIGEAADERVHGVVTWSAAQDGAGEPQDAQLGDLQATRRRLENHDRRREAAVHRRGETAASSAHEGKQRPPPFFINLSEDVGQSLALACPAVLLDACVQRISCTSYRTIVVKVCLFVVSL